MRRAITLLVVVIACLAALLGEMPAPRADSAQYYYDPAGRLTTVVDPVNGSAQYTYDSSGNILSVARRPITAIVVAQLAPSSGVTGTTVTISGTGFGSTANTTVSFNGHAATPSAVSATQIAVTVPSGAVSGPVTVTSPAGTAASVSSFTVLTGAAPTIASLSPTQVDQGSTVTISGSNFDPLPVNDKVFVNGVYAQITTASASSLSVVAPVTTPGHVQVATPNGSAASSGYLVVPPLPYLASNIGSVVQSSLGSSATSSLGTAGKFGLILFDATAGQQVSMEVTASTFSAATLALYGPGNTAFSQPTTISSGSFIDKQVLPISGTYTVLIAPSSTATGSATINLINVPPDASATIAANATPVSLTTTAPGQNMSLTFAGTAGQRIALNTQYSGSLASNCNAWDIIGPAGSTQLYSGSTCGASFFTGVLTLPSAGTYTIQVDPASTATGTATFTLYNVPADVTSTIAANATPVSLTTTAPGQSMRLTFAGTVGQRIALKDQYDSNINATCATWAIIDPDGTTQLYSSRLTCGTPNFTDVLILPTNGTYTILLTPGWPAKGTATFTLYTVPADATATIAANGTPVSLTTTVPGQNMNLTFTGTAGQRIALKDQYDSNLNASCSMWTIVEPDGKTQLYSALTCGTPNFTDVLILPSTGTYTIQFNPGSTTTGTATFTLYNVPADASATITAGGGSVAVTTTVPGQNLSLTFAGTAGHRVSLLGQYDSNLSSSCYGWKIIEPDGATQLFSVPTACGASSFTGVLTLPTTGTYAINFNPGSTATGTATFTLYNVPADAAGTTSIGQAAANYTTTVPGQAIRVSFAGSANQSVTVKVGVVSSSPSYPCYNITTLDPNGTTVLRGDLSCSSAYSSGSLILPQAGTYTVVVAPTSTTIGTFSVGVSTP